MPCYGCRRGECCRSCADCPDCGVTRNCTYFQHSKQKPTQTTSPACPPDCNCFCCRRGLA